ncbi:MAG: PTS sorbitol transporter subunit IIB [Ruminococcaceae bacterium]|nr:PTS sorbitol transporter subunit IIB [Oscillospiraceae bacterium]
MEKILVAVSSAMGKFVMVIYESGKKAVQIAIQTILPFLLFVAAVATLITTTGVGNVLADWLSALASNPIGLLVMSLIITFPLISPVIGPGAVIPSVIGVLVGTQIAAGNVPLSMALPAVFAIHQPCGSDFIPIGMSLMDSDPATVEVGVPAVLYSKLIIAPVEVGLAILIGLFLF